MPSSERSMPVYLLCSYLVCHCNLHTYIIDHYKPSVRIIDLVSHTTYVMCVNFIHKWRYLQFKVDSERQIFWETFHDNFNLLSEFFPEICREEIAVGILFVFCFDVWSGAIVTWWYENHIVLLPYWDTYIHTSICDSYTRFETQKKIRHCFQIQKNKKISDL